MNETEEPIVNEKEIKERVLELIEEKKIQDEEIKELVGEIRVDNKEIFDIMKSTLYKTLFQVLQRVTLKMEITNLENLKIPAAEKKTAAAEKVKSNSSGNKKSTKSNPYKSDKKEDDFLLENVDVKHETDKAYLLENVDNKVSWIPKVAMKKIDTEKKTALIHGWFVSKIEWNDPKPFN